MEFESYLTEQKSQIVAINRVSQILYRNICDNYYEILKGKINKNYLDNIIALVYTIQSIAYCMRCFRAETFQEIGCNHSDNFIYSSVIQEDF